MQRVWLKITELAGQPELCSGYKGRSSQYYINLPGYICRLLLLLLPLAEPSSGSLAQPELGSAKGQPRFVGTALPEPARALSGPSKAKTAPGSGCCCLVVCLAFRPGLRRDLRVSAADEAPGTVAIPAVRAQEVAVSGTYRRVLDVGQHYPAARAARGNFLRGAASAGRPPRSAGVSSPGQSPGYSP